MRVFNFLLKCHIDFAFVMPMEERIKFTPKKVEDILNSLRCHGENVKIVVDKQVNGMTFEIA